MSADYQVCTFRFTGSDQEGDLDPQEAINRALKENPRNASISPPVKNDAEGLNQGPTQLAIWTAKLWALGRTLRIGFLGGSQWQQNKVKQYAPDWCQYANIIMTFPASGPYDILISFDATDGSWSYHGTDSSFYSSTNRASMNYGWIEQSQSEDELRRVVLHEFGHALGAIHEHQSPLETIQWNKEVVYQSLGGPPNNWPRPKIDANMFVKYDFGTVQQREFDPASIMLYSFPSSWTLNNAGTSWNSSLSQGDKDYIAFCYPGFSLDAGIFNTLELRPWFQPQLNNSHVEVYRKPYGTAPRIAVGLNFLDLDQATNPRLRATASNIGTDKFTANLNAWADTKLYTAGMTWLELGPRFDAVQMGTFDTLQVRPWNQPRPETSMRINFPQAFASPPKIVLWLSGIDVDRSKNWRVATTATNVDNAGFTVHISSWADTILYSATATWLAYPADRTDMFSGRFDTRDVRPWNAPQQETAGYKAFPTGLRNVPKVAMGVDSLDYQMGKNLRFRVSTSSVTPQGMVWHLSSWADSVQYSAGAQYFGWV